MTAIFKNKQFYFRFIDNNNSYLIDKNQNEYNLNEFHNSWFPVFKAYHYRKVFISGYYNSVLGEIIIYQISLVNQLLIGNHIHKYFEDNPNMFNEARRVEESKMFFMRWMTYQKA